ncbi:hypothetical protein MMC07_009782 [Pseudocyphellaria aurata]|nr:hypothetical protein [Pseudocyphellaria aurata]
MTDFSLTLKSHTAPVVDPIAGPAPSSAKLPYPSKSTELLVDDEEDYTIKCICGFQDDDGNTVLCERCETWQHIVCYYFTSEEGTIVDVSNIDHNCADCEPRPLDTKGATERQSKRREEPDSRKPKKTTTKSHKKKVKIPESNFAPMNGWSHDSHERTSRSPKDQLPPAAKKTKTSHRPGSINFPPGPLNSVSQTGKRSASSSRTFHSPTDMPHSHSPNGYSSEPYSLEFLHLYDNDPGDAPMQANLFNDITITGSLSSWSHDVESLRDAANGLSPQDVFHRCDHPLDSMKLPCLRKDHKKDLSYEIDGHHPRWKFLIIDSLTPKDSIVGELRGKIGHMQDYVQDPVNRWDYLRHPVPFVFFHPKLPIYIDTRCEGTTCRYLRRSCRPNLSMKTILENGSDYHFCFVAKHDLEAGSELTIGWVLDEHIRNFVHHRHHDETKQDDAEEDYVTDWVGKVLADFGGCACNTPSQCALARYDRRHGGSTNNSTRQLPNGKSTKGRNGYANKPSPPSTGQATNSRAGSEVFKHQDDEDHDDNRSTSGSMRSKARSRDLTPTPRISGEMSFVELSDRDKRKIAAVEKNFEQLEQDRPAPKKKKRNSGGSTLNTPTATTSKPIGISATSFSQPNTPGLHSKPRYMEASTSGRRSGSPGTRSSHIFATPNTPLSTGSLKRLSQPHIPSATSPLVRHNYVSSSMQTDAGERNDWYDLTVPNRSRQSHYTSLTKRLLLRCQKDRERLATAGNAAYSISTEIPDHDISSSPADESKDHDMLETVDAAPINATEDFEMKDIKHDKGLESGGVSSNIPVQKPRPPDLTSKNPESITSIEINPPPPPWPAQAVQPAHHGHINGYHSIELRVQLPPTLQIPNEPGSEPSDVLAPNPVSARSPSTQNSNSHPPTFPPNASSLVHPSPVKKKVSLVDYISRLSNSKAESQSALDKNAGASPALLQNSVKVSAGREGDPKILATEGSAIADTPMKEADDPLAQGKDVKL